MLSLALGCFIFEQTFKLVIHTGNSSLRVFICSKSWIKSLYILQILFVGFGPNTSKVCGIVLFCFSSYDCVTCFKFVTEAYYGFAYNNSTHISVSYLFLFSLLAETTFQHLFFFCLCERLLLLCLADRLTDSLYYWFTSTSLTPLNYKAAFFSFSFF